MMAPNDPRRPALEQQLTELKMESEKYMEALNLPSQMKKSIIEQANKSQMKQSLLREGDVMREFGKCLAKEEALRQKIASLPVGDPRRLDLEAELQKI